MDLPACPFSMQNQGDCQGATDNQARPMRKAIEFVVSEVTPGNEEVLEVLGMGGRTNIPARILALIREALDIFRQLAAPRGLMADLTTADFEKIYQVDGNSPKNPVRWIFPKAEALALFAVTMGGPLTEKGSELFSKGGPALGYMLEAVATAGAERLGSLMSQCFQNLLLEGREQPADFTALHYSPGNCGWHLSSQEKIFNFLRPEEIGIGLSSSFHMRPQKSLSGVLIAGPKEIHRFTPEFPPCLQCKTHKCAQRLARLRNNP